MFRRSAAEAIHEAIAFAEGAVDSPFNPRDSESLTTLIALRESDAFAEAWPYEAANLMRGLVALELTPGEAARWI
jgi:hypothetical protein